jgi:excisionase family DNA binding protein
MDDKQIPAVDFALFSDPYWAARFPPVLTVAQAAELLKVPIRTIYSWSSRGLLDRCAAKVGKHLRIRRDRLIQTFWPEIK